MSNFVYEIPIQEGSAANSLVTAASTCSSSVTLSPSGTCALTTELEGYFPGTTGTDNDRGWVAIVQGAIPTFFGWIDNGTLSPSTRVLNINTSLTDL
jgi:hypothetical protein